MIGKKSWKNEFKGEKNEEENLRPREPLFFTTWKIYQHAWKLLIYRFSINSYTVVIQNSKLKAQEREQVKSLQVKVWFWLSIHLMSMDGCMIGYYIVLKNREFYSDVILATKDEIKENQNFNRISWFPLQALVPYCNSIWVVCIQI